MGVLIPIKPLNSISLKVDGSNLHPSIVSSVESKIPFRMRDPSDRVSFFPSREVNLHARFSEGIGNLTGNAKGDRRKEDRRTYRKITGGCRSIRDLGLN
ncbi:hypothetical protein GW17_00041173 [Ensete ventricosum]|nr:hypothetical protein GW17_00041173 [Ensete ventricosum]